MIHTVRTVRTLQAVAMTVGIAVFLWSTGLPSIFHVAEAASITYASDTLSNSAPGLPSNHTIVFTTPNGLVAGQTMTLTFEAGFPLPGAGFDYNDIDVLDDSTDISLKDGLGAGGQWGVATTSTTITFDLTGAATVSSSSVITIRIGNNAIVGASGTTQIVNPSATTSYAIDIGGSMTDSGQVRVAIIDQVTVSASVNTSLSFTVSGVNASSTVNGSPTTTAATTTSTALPFGTLGINRSKILAHDLAVVTNATHGYTVTVEQTGALQSTTGATIDGFIDGANTQTPTAWQGPGAQVANTASYGHWGLTSTDGTTTRSQEFGSDQWVSGSTTPVVIMGHDGPADGTTQGYGAARIGYQIEISALQEAGSDYNTTLRYIATPTF